MKNRQYVPVIMFLLVICLMAFLYGCGTNATGGGGGASLTPWIYVGASVDHAVSIINGSTNTLAGTIELAPRTPYHIAASPDGKHLYVSTDSPEVVVIDTATNTISGLITPEPGVNTLSLGLAVSGNGAFLYFTRNNDNKLVRVHLTDNPVTSEIVSTTHAGSTGMILANDDEKSIVCEAPYLEFFDNATFMSHAVINAGGSVYSAAIKDGLVYVPRKVAAGDVLIIDPTAEAVQLTITGEATDLFGIVSIPGGNKLYVTQPYLTDGKISIIDTSSTPTFESTVITGEAVTNMANPTYMAATADGKYVYVYDSSHILHTQLCVVYTVTNKVTKSIPINTGLNTDNNPVIIYK